MQTFTAASPCPLLTASLHVDPSIRGVKCGLGVKHVPKAGSSLPRLVTFLIMVHLCVDSILEIFFMNTILCGKNKPSFIKGRSGLDMWSGSRKSFAGQRQEIGSLLGKGTRSGWYRQNCTARPEPDLRHVPPPL